MANSSIRVYFDACCYIDLVQYDESINQTTNNPHILMCRTFINAARAKDIELYGSTILVAECTAVKDNKDNKVVNEDVKAAFRSILLSGSPVFPIQPTPKIIDKARDLSWVDGLSFGSIDAIHLATAIVQKCEIFITSDNGILKYKNQLAKLHSLSAGNANDFESFLPDKYRQKSLALKVKK